VTNATNFEAGTHWNFFGALCILLLGEFFVLLSGCSGSLYDQCHGIGNGDVLKEFLRHCAFSYLYAKVFGLSKTPRTLAAEYITVGDL